MGSQEDPDIIIREAMVEGIFYPSNVEELRSALRDLISASETLAGEASLIVSPHGSFEFSGKIMASAFKGAAARKPERIIIIGSCSHSENVQVCLPESAIFRTPLADSKVDRAFITAIMDTSTLIQKNDVPHLQEHSIEVQLPFTQYLFPDALIVPILVGKSSEASYKSLRTALQVAQSLDNRSTLTVISANLTALLDRSKASRQAQHMIDLILDGKTSEIVQEGIRGDLSSENALALAYAASFSETGELTILARDSSLSVHYDPTGVVEYVAIAVL